MKSYAIVFPCIIALISVFFSCENPADSANDYALEDNVFHSLLKEEHTEVEEMDFENSDMEELMEVPPSEQPAPPPPAVYEDRKLIKTAQLSIQVNDMEMSSRTLDSLLKIYQAYISQDDFQNSPNRKNRTLTIRVPAEQLDGLVIRLVGMGEYLAQRSVYVRDVSEQYTDTELRLKSKRAVLDQYLKLLDRAQKMEDVLKIENEIRVIREEIEAKEGQLRYMSNQVTLSTVHLEMYQDILHAQTSPANSFWRKAGDRLVFGWQLIQGISLAILAMWPLLLLGIGVWGLIRVWKRKKRLSA